jgi:hypothetical protein
MLFTDRFLISYGKTFVKNQSPLVRPDPDMPRLPRSVFLAQDDRIQDAAGGILNLLAHRPLLHI